MVEIFCLGHIYVQKVNLASDLLGVSVYINSKKFVKKDAVCCSNTPLKSNEALEYSRSLLHLEQTEQFSHTTKRPQ